MLVAAAYGRRLCLASLIDDGAREPGRLDHEAVVGRTLFDVTDDLDDQVLVRAELVRRAHLCALPGPQRNEQGLGMMRLVPETSSFSLLPPAMNTPFRVESSSAVSFTGFSRTTYSPSFATTNARASIGACSNPPRPFERTMRSLADGVNSVGPTCMRISPLVSFRDLRNERRGTGIF
jgi:hypothetical protein